MSEQFDEVHSVRERRAQGCGWGLLRAVTSLLVTAFLLWGLWGARQPVWISLMIALAGGFLWWGAAKTYAWKAFLVLGPLGTLVFSLVLILTGYLVHGGGR